ncbi:MAG: type I restriction enzyme HsdR N-terminal domain-containing protein [Prevotella sp.]|nr:type I restriction enzyme HsdR N-terminal domain-containing protein [Prevotella sp.]
MLELNLPKFDIKIRKNGSKMQVLDMLRRKYVALTPEEFVRQHFVNYLTAHRNYPPTLVANEVELSVGNKHLRCDSVVYDSSLSPRVIVEYKAPTVAITQQVLNQISAYNLLLHVDYLMISNGLEHFCCRMDYDNNTYVFLDHIPAYEEL